MRNEKSETTTFLPGKEERKNPNWGTEENKEVRVTRSETQTQSRGTHFGRDTKTREKGGRDMHRFVRKHVLEGVRVFLDV